VSERAALREFAQRLKARGKPSKVALIAVARKCWWSPTPSSGMAWRGRPIGPPRL